MKRFVFAVILCIGLLFIVGLNFILPPAEAQEDVLQKLLDLPAPPPPNPLFRVRYGANRADEFYSKKTPPADDAPLEDLLEYWQSQSANYQELGYNIAPSEKTLERILEDVKENPETLPQFLNSLPRTDEVVEIVKKLYDENKGKDSDEESEINENWLESVQRWLKFNSKYFSDELFEVANQAADTDEYVSNQDELLALARVDWDKARPIVERLYNDKNNKAAGVLARWAFYTHALEEESLDADTYRDELKAIVEDRNATPGMRDLALDALMKEKEWAGRDEWYMTLLGDETLAELKVDGRVFTGLTTIIYHSPPDKFVERMLELLKSDNPTIRTAAIRNLGLMITPENKEVVRALLPWLSDAKWAKQTNDERKILVAALQSIVMNESVPGLISILNEKSTISVYSNSTTLSNVMMNKLVPNPTPPVNTTGNVAKTETMEVFQYRREAISALEKQADSRAVPALREILPQVEPWERATVVRAILLSNGFSVGEQIDALESIVKSSINNSMSNSVSNAVNTVSNTIGGNSSIYYGNGYYPTNRIFDPSEIKPILGNLLLNNYEPKRDFVVALAARINELERKDAALAKALRDIMKRWNGAAINSLFLADLKNGRAGIDAIVKLLSIRKELREKQLNEVFDARGTNPMANAISACIMENPADYEAILNGDNVQAKIALFGCARLVRAQLPIDKAAAYTKSSDKMLATAAERWLESDDSPQARQIVLANNPNKAKILGARISFIADEKSEVSSDFLSSLFNSIEGSSYFPYYGEYTSGYLEITEKRLQEEILKDKNLLGVYAYDKNFIRLYNDKMIFSWEEDEARYNERTLTKDEFEELKNYLIAQNVDSLKPFLSLCYDCYERELLMLGAAGGRRVYVRSQRTPPFFAGLDKYFVELQKQPAKLRYYLENDIAGLEILFTDKNLKALTLWKNGADFRVLISDTAQRAQVEKELDEQYEADIDRDDIDYGKLEEEHGKRRRQREFEHLSWRGFSGESLGNAVESPKPNDLIPTKDNFSAQASSEQWKARTATIEVREGEDDLIKIVGGKESKLATGSYTNPIISANGRWVLATKYDREGEQIKLVRINLATNKEFQVKLDNAAYLQGVSFMASVNKFLLSPGGYYQQTIDPEGFFFLLDPETGVIQETKGDFRAIAQQTIRPLQPTGTPDEFWAAIPGSEKSETHIGVYNAKTFAFKPLMKVPSIKFDSMQMWVDGGKIYFTYEGHLLALPLK